MITPEIGKALFEKASPDAIRNLAEEQGMTTLAADGVRRAAQGETSLAEVIRILA